MSNETHAERSLAHIREWMRQHNVSPYRLAALAGVGEHVTRGILDRGYLIRNDLLELLEKTAQGTPEPVKIGRPRNGARKTA